MRRGEVWWYEQPDDKRRPVLILTRDEAIERLNDVLVVPATTTVRGVATEVELSREDGMPSECALSLDNTFLAQKSLLTERVTALGSHKIAEVCAALQRATSC